MITLGPNTVRVEATVLGNVLIVIGVVTGLLGVLMGLYSATARSSTSRIGSFLCVNWLERRSEGLIRLISEPQIGARYNRDRRRFVYIGWGALASFIESTTITFTIQGHDEITIPRDPVLADFLVNWDWFLFIFVMLTVAGLLSNILLVRLLGQHPSFGFLKISAIVIIVYAVGRIALELISVKWARVSYPDGMIDVIATITHVLFSAIGFVLVFPLVVFYAAFISLYLVEFLVRRIAEQPKGPLAAFSALVTAAGGILKAFA